MKWAHPVAKFWLAGLTVAVLGFLGTLFVAQGAQAAPPASANWVNRFYITDSNGQNYLDSDTYDNTYSYAEQSPKDGCQDRITFVYLGDSSLSDPFRNANFFYNPNLANLPNQLWRVQFEENTQYNPGTGGTACGNHLSGNNGHTVSNIAVGNVNNRRVTFYKNAQDQIFSISKNIMFTRQGAFAGADRYFRADEVADTNNSCPDMILSHNANINTSGEAVFGRGEIANSSMLYAVRKDDQLNRTAESYDRATEPNQIPDNECQIESDAINGRKGGHYGISGYDDNGQDNYYLAGGLQANGAPATGGEEEDDAIIIFVGDVSNLPKDATGAPITTPGTPPDGGDKVDQQVCKGGALGWLVCPIVSAIQSAINLLRETMEYFLTVNPLPIGSGAIYDSWNNVRNFSNIAFAMAFFIIIFSQATSIGISNYGIKRLLPRLVLVAIGTNLSYFICSFMIDIFNILGVGITNLFALANGGAAGAVEVGTAGEAVFVSGLVAGITWAFVSGQIVQIFPLIAAAFMAFFITFVILVARQAIIILLVVFSPLAFVAGLLPGTQNWFRRWFEMFSTLLLMYPFIMGLFAAGRLASSILTAAAGG